MRSDSRMFLKGSMIAVGQTFLSVPLLKNGQTGECLSLNGSYAQPTDRQECLSYNKNPAPNNAGLQYSHEVFRVSSDWVCPSCLAVCFTWPQVALTHHVYICAYTPCEIRLSSTTSRSQERERSQAHLPHPETITSNRECETLIHLTGGRRAWPRSLCLEFDGALKLCCQEAGAIVRR